MIVYIDSSVILRKLFNEKDPLTEWPKISQAFSSRILLVEVARVLDRTRLAGKIDDEQVANLHDEFHTMVHSIDVAGLTEDVLLLATGPMPVALGTLDALHLATALAIKRNHQQAIAMATHDVQLARGARAFGIEVVGA